MKEVCISEFKTKCFAMLEEVRKAKKSILVTRFGKPIAKVHPPSPLQEGGIWLGSMVGKSNWETL